MLFCTPALSSEEHWQLQRRSALDHCKWHRQVHGQSVWSPFALVLPSPHWHELALRAEGLAAEALAAEQELLHRPELFPLLGISRPLQRLLCNAQAASDVADPVRVMRFDFHPTSAGWQISEGNTDVASGYIEASAVTHLTAKYYQGYQTAGDPALALAKAIRAATGPSAAIALMHLAEDTDDRQIMLYFAHRLEEAGLNPCLCSPGQLRWGDQGASACCDWFSGPVALIFRFFPAHWLPGLAASGGWRKFSVGKRTAICNPVCSLLSQSKRLPLVWDRLSTPLPTWRALLPESRSPQDIAPEDSRDWVIKPAFGFEGWNVALAGATEEHEWQHLAEQALRRPRDWVAQRRFEAIAVATPAGPKYPCLGVYVINGHAEGIYGRLSSLPLINESAEECAVLIP